MRKNYCYLVVMAALIAANSSILYSCSQDVITDSDSTDPDSDTEVVLDVTTSIAVASRSVTDRPINSFSNSDEIGLFVSSGEVNAPYNGIITNSNMKSTLATQWQQESPVYLSSAMATIYAYYPYSNAVTDGTKVEINHVNQTDYMYGTKVENINNRNPKAEIIMNHALSLVQFNFIKENYTGIGNLTAIRIANKEGGNILRSQATLDLTDGAITTNPSTTEPVIRATNIPQIINSTWTESNYPQMLVMPTEATLTTGDIVISFTVDGQVYDWPVPAGTTWEQGKKNTYTVTIKGTALEVSPVTITAWGVGTADSGAIQ